MSHEPFGATGLEVPPIAFGTSSLGNLFQAYSDESKLAVSKAWFDQVKTPIVIDTAGKYGAGLSLEVIGRNLRTLGIPPEDVLISNKLGWYRIPLKGDEPTFEPGAWMGLEYDAEQRISYAGILACWEQGAALLGEPYRADLLSVHDPDEYLAAATSDEDRQQRITDICEAYKALHELKADGKVKAIGMGSKDWRVIKELSELVELDWVMLANSFTIYRHPIELQNFVETLARHKIGIINSAVFHAGFLVGGPFFDYREVSEDSADDQPLFVWREQFFALCEEFNVKPAEACIEFAHSPPGVQALALSSSKPERIIQDAKAVAAKAPVDFWKAMKTAGLIAPDYPYL